MNSISIAARVTSDMIWKKESPYVQFTIRFIGGTYRCLLHESRLNPKSKIEKGGLIQIDATVLDSKELMISYYIIITEEKRISRQETNFGKIFNAAGEELKVDKYEF